MLRLKLGRGEKLSVSSFQWPVSSQLDFLLAGYWLLATGYWLLETGYWKLAAPREYFLRNSFIRSFRLALSDDM